MEKLAKTIGIIFGMFLISLASAITIYSGDSYSFESEEFEYYTVINNKSNMDGMNISWDGNTTISFSKYFASDNFTILFFNKEKEIITEHHYSSGGSSSKTIYKDKNITEYIDNTIYLNNQTETDTLNDKINKLEKDLKNKKTLNDISRILIAVLSILLIIIVFCMIKKYEKE